MKTKKFFIVPRVVVEEGGMKNEYLTLTNTKREMKAAIFTKAACLNSVFPQDKIFWQVA